MLLHAQHRHSIAWRAPGRLRTLPGCRPTAALGVSKVGTDSKGSPRAVESSHSRIGRWRRLVLGGQWRRQARRREHVRPECVRGRVQV